MKLLLSITCGSRPNGSLYHLLTPIQYIELLKDLVRSEQVIYAHFISL